ncbi:MAG TPA: lipid-binding SYLF domain-containing protein [Kofleriaceae bacterium]|nr:lipid-binding SYLF domain-containing protein [Kofleriaceae bacterium]
MSLTRTIALLAALFAGCATAPATRAEKQSLQQSADATLAEMYARNPAVQEVTRHATAYAVFPSIAKGGALVGGAYGKGILYENGVATGYVSLQQASIGAELGGQSFAELLILRNPEEITAVKSGDFTAGASAGVVVLGQSTGAAASFDDNTASVFVLPHGGLMVDVSVNGQQVKYQSFNA